MYGTKELFILPVLISQPDNAGANSETSIMTVAPIDHHW